AGDHGARRIIRIHRRLAHSRCAERAQNLDPCVLNHERISSMSPEVATGTAEPAPMAARDGRKNRNVRIVRIQWGDCDPAGIIFNARYFEIFDASTAALFEAALGITKREMLEKYNSAGIALVRTAATFHKPVRFGEDVAVESVISFSRSSF